MTIGETLLPPVSERGYNPVHNVGRALIDAASLMTRAVDRRAQEVGISGPQWVVLIRIGGGIGNTATELCRSLGYDSGAMTRMLDRLVKLGLVRRAPSPGDGRGATLSLTPVGEALYPRLRPIAVEVIDEHLVGFSPEEIAQFMNYLDRVVANGQAARGGGNDCNDGPSSGGTQLTTRKGAT